MLEKLNSPVMYLIVGVAIASIAVMCIFFMVKSYKAGVKLGMDKKILKKTIVSSATFSVLPAFSILLGVIALSGSLGIPFPWLRLSIIGNLQYEINVAEIAATRSGLSGLKITEMTPESFVTIALVMTAGILGGILMCIFTLPKYSRKLNSAVKAKGNSTKKSFGDWAMIAMFVGMCTTYIGSYVGKLRGGEWMPIVTAIIAALVMGICEFFERKKKCLWLENFDLAISMLVAMASIVFINMAV